MSTLLPTARLQIRVMQLEDLVQVQAIDRSSFSLPWPESAYRHEIEDNRLSLCLVAEAQEPGSKARIISLIVIWLVLDEAHIATIATHPEYRHQGVARAILAVALRQSIQRGAKMATLEVRASNLHAQALYRQFGFENVGRRRRYYRDNQEDALLMTVGALDEIYYDWLLEMIPDGIGY
jgi:ribosomal-protein-alanine N-acetyltransferase